MKKFTLLLLSLVFALSTIALAACKHEHEFSTSLTAGDTSHYYVCECGEKKDEASHVFDNACDTTCNTCGKTRSTSHSYATTLTAGDTTHYYACECGAKNNEVEHVFAQVKNDTTFVSETATTATYKKSCTCGKLSNETFTVDKIVTRFTNMEVEYEYTGRPVDFVFDINSNGAVTYVWYEDGDSTPLSEAPDYVGEFSVVISVAGTREYTALVDEFGFEITPKLLPIPTVLTKTYDGTSIFTYTFDETATGTGESVTVKLDLRDRNPESNPVKNAGTYDETTVDLWAEFYWGGTNTVTSCYDFVDEYYHNQAEYDITINKKVLSNLTLSVVYNGSTYHEGVVPDGVVAGDEFLADIDLYNKNVGTYTCYAAGMDESVCWEDITCTGADYDNYQIDRATTTVIVTPKVLEGTWSVGVSWLAPGISYSSEKDLYWYTVYVPTQYGAVSSGSVVLLVYFDTKDINAQFVEARLTAADANANYIYDSEKLILTNPIKNTTNSFDSVLTIGCQTAQSYTSNMVAGQKVYIKINGAGGTLNDFYFKATTGSTATFTWEYYDATDITTPEAVESTATDTAFVDICDTENCYLVVTCVTAGEVSITSSL